MKTEYLRKFDIDNSLSNKEIGQLLLALKRQRGHLLVSQNWQPTPVMLFPIKEHNQLFKNPYGLYIVHDEEH